MVLQILHSACGCVQDDKSSGIQDDKRVAVQDDRRQASSMVTRNVFLSTSRCHSEQSEESGEEEWDNGPRTSQIRILLKYRLLQKSIVRGPHFFWGDREQGCFALYCTSADYKKLMFAVRCPQKSAGTLILCGSTLSKGAKHIGVLNEAKNLVWQADIMNRGGASDPSLTLRMTKGTVRRTKGRSGGQRDGREDKGT